MRISATTESVDSSAERHSRSIRGRPPPLQADPFPLTLRLRIRSELQLLWVRTRVLVRRTRLVVSASPFCGPLAYLELVSGIAVGIPSRFLRRTSLQGSYSYSTLVCTHTSALLNRAARLSGEFGEAHQKNNLGLAKSPPHNDGTAETTTARRQRAGGVARTDLSRQTGADRGGGGREACWFRKGAARGG